MESALLAGIIAWFASVRLRTYLQYFQQEEYNSPRFLSWWLEAHAYDRWATLGLAVMLPFALVQPAATGLMVMVWLFWRGKQEPDSTRVGKKPLVLTPRATQLWLVAGMLSILPAAACALMVASNPLLTLLGAVVLIQLLPLFLVAAVSLQRPLQLWQNRRYLTEATQLLRHLNPTVVSISGAFGKTSTKYFLGRILSAHAPTLVSPGSTNTPLGLARVVREQLQPHHQYFLAEMGAYQIGSIAGICRLFPPAACATTAIGVAHYERFKSLHAVARAEFEVLDATLAGNRGAGGPAVLSIDCIPAELWQPRVKAAPHIKLVGTDKALLRPSDYWIKLAKQTPHGLHLAIEHKGQLTAFATKIFGATMAPNLATAFALATELGVPTATSAAALSDVQPAPHRLAIRQEGALTIIDDSYNSNPGGFRTALETLTLVARSTGKKMAHAAPARRILITPGMVELGTLHAAEHAAIGTYAAQHADVILAVLPQRIPTFIAAVQAAGTAQLIQVPTFAAAQQWLQTNAKAGDIILLENDLPDRYEAVWKL